MICNIKEFTEEELTQYNGENGKPVYIAYKGKVYDGSTSFLWRERALEMAPHSDDIIQKLPKLGFPERHAGF